VTKTTRQGAHKVRWQTKSGNSVTQKTTSNGLAKLQGPTKNHLAAPHLGSLQSYKRG